jgi:signal transduction histidine kinase
LVSALVNAVREAGLPLEFTVEGHPYQVAEGVDLAAYRIVQEALTNALKHNGHAATSLTLRYDESAIVIEVVDNGSSVNGEAGGTGRGLVGMRERATLYGGALNAGPKDDGGFQVVATLPLDRDLA